MNITLTQLQAIMPQAGHRAPLFLDPLNKAMDAFGIDSEPRTAAFLAQVAHESGQLVYTQELASGAAYEGRGDLGNMSPGDGVKYKGRGLIQITGKYNYEALAKALGIDCVNHPELIELDEYAAASAGWFWQSKKLNQYVDMGDFVTLTKRINGGLNGYADRVVFWDKAKEVLAQAPVVATASVETIVARTATEPLDEQKPAQAY